MKSDRDDSSTLICAVDYRNSDRIALARHYLALPYDKPKQTEILVDHVGPPLCRLDAHNGVAQEAKACG